MGERIYSINQSTITVLPGDITKSKAEVIVSSDDGDISRGGGVSLAIKLEEHGPPDEEIRKHVPAKVGNVVVTNARRLPARYILHGITLPSLRETEGSIELPDGVVVRKIVQQVMELVPLLGCSSVAFPVIGAGVAGVAYEVASAKMVEVLIRRLIDSDRPYCIELYLHDRFRQWSPEQLAELFDARIQETLGLYTTQGGDQVELIPPATLDESKQGQIPSAERRRQEVYEMLLHLGRQRDSFESQLLIALQDPTTFSQVDITHLRRQLEEIAKLRRIYLAELQPIHLNSKNVKRDTVFVSSTFIDLETHRCRIIEVIEELGLECVGMEGFGPAAINPGEYIRQKVEQSEIYLGIIGMRYGSMDPTSGLSMTELEYRQAVASSKPRLMFVMDKSAPLTVDMIEPTSDGYAKLLGFRGHVLQSHVCGLFTNREDLAAKVRKALQDYLSERDRSSSTA